MRGSDGYCRYTGQIPNHAAEGGWVIGQGRTSGDWEPCSRALWIVPWSCGSVASAMICLALDRLSLASFRRRAYELAFSPPHVDKLG